MFHIFLKAAIFIYDAGHTAKTQHHILKYKREVISLNIGINLCFLLHIISFRCNKSMYVYVYRDNSTFM